VGDIDRDGASNSRDALLVLSKVVELPVDTIIDTVSTSPLVVDTLHFDSGLGDVNADGAVTSVDALIILSTAVGIPIPGQRVMLLAPAAAAPVRPRRWPCSRAARSSPWARPISSWRRGKTQPAAP